MFGINGLKLWRYANGTDESRVMQKDFVSPVKSVGHGITCTADLDNEEEVFHVLLELSQDVGHRLRVHGLAQLPAFRFLCETRAFTVPSISTNCRSKRSCPLK